MNAATQQMAPALVLNADFRPLSYYPLSLWSWQDSIKAVCLNKVSIIEEYATQVTSPSCTMTLPSVIALKRYVQRDQTPAFTRFNLFLRDRFTCQYCQSQLPAQALTFDHVVPRSKGGTTHWENIVACCESCNRKKANQSLEQCAMQLAKPPKPPTLGQLQRNGRRFAPNYLHHTWHDYLYWDSHLESSV